MEKFDELLRTFDLAYCGQGKHKISFEKMMELRKGNSVEIIDIRTKEENLYVQFNFAKNIQMHDIPDRINEISRDKTVVLFCFSGTRASIVFAYLKTKGYDDVRILTIGISEIAGYIKPGFVQQFSPYISKPL